MPFCHAGQVWCFGQYYRASNEKFFPVHGVRAAVLSGQTWSSATGALRTMARHGRSEETLKLTIISRWLSVTIDGVGRMIALGAIGALTFLGALYLCLHVLSAA
jgi:hypothetical protein